MADKSTLPRRALELIAADTPGLVAGLAVEFGLSRQAVNNQLRRLVRDGLIDGSGTTRARRYHLRVQQEAERSYECAGLREDVVWGEVFAPVVADLPENVRDIWRYGVTEMVNNAVEHSGAARVDVGIRRNALRCEGWVADRGEGIFRKIQRALGLYDPRESILELAKGKLTTDPARHSGEGIFFTARAFDAFEIRSATLRYLHGGGDRDWLTEHPTESPGTLVLLRLDNASGRQLKSVFDEFAAPEDYAFSRTVVPVKLAQHEGEKLVSRSQARRLCARFERFRHVVLDFAGVTEIGQAFADEVFRVFAAAHPATELSSVNVAPPVGQMIARASGRRAEEARAGYAVNR